jgi:hypothetical protein
VARTTPARSLAALGQAPDISPPDYAYLDNAQVALYLGQLQGGIANSEQLTQQLVQSRTAGLTAGGASLGGSVGSTATAQRVVTPNATARFYQLLDLLRKDSYITKIDMKATPKHIVSAFTRVEEGSFVELHNCAVQLPAYVELLEAARSRGFNFGDPFGFNGDKLLNGTHAPITALILATGEAKRPKFDMASVQELDSLPEGNGTYRAGEVEKVDGAIRTLVKTTGSNPRVPLASCDANTTRTSPAGSTSSCRLSSRTSRPSRL